MTPETRAARERKQKIFVVVGGLLLLALLAIQLPKLLGGSSSPEAAATTTTAAQTPGQPAQAGAAPVALAVPVETGKLTSLSAFERKDPFVQQVVAQNGADAPAAGASAGKGSVSGQKAEKPTTFSTGSPSMVTTCPCALSLNDAARVNPIVPSGRCTSKNPSP